MARKKVDIDALFSTLPDLPDDFEKWSLEQLDKIPVFYKRQGKYSDCNCGKCGANYVVDYKPVRKSKALCPVCGHVGWYEWKKVTTRRFETRTTYIIQKTKSNDLVIRIFEASQQYQQGYIADIKLTERRRIFLKLGESVKLYNGNHYTSNGWQRRWGTEADYEAIYDGPIYPGYEYDIKESNLKYCNVNEINAVAGIRTCYYQAEAVTNALIAYANNPAIEMYAKTGMKELVNLLIYKEGKDKRIYRRGKTPLAQLRLRDKRALRRLIESKGNMITLEILQAEKKRGYRFSPEEERFLERRYGSYGGKEQIEFLTKYMSLQQLINRIIKYECNNEYNGEYQCLSHYYDYLRMREELGYDMANEVFLYPRSLKGKHNEMVLEKRARDDELYISRKMKRYSKIAERFEALVKKYTFAKDGYVIRPARSAGEIIVEGRTLHHCVGGDRYLGEHNNGNSYILFLRKEVEPDEPYYTIQIRGKEILQWYGMKDKKPDKEIIGPWLDEYVKHLKSGKKFEKDLKAAV